MVSPALRLLVEAWAASTVGLGTLLATLTVLSGLRNGAARVLARTRHR